MQIESSLARGRDAGDRGAARQRAEKTEDGTGIRWGRDEWAPEIDSTDDEATCTGIGQWPNETELEILHGPLRPPQRTLAGQVNRRWRRASSSDFVNFYSAFARPFGLVAVFLILCGDLSTARHGGRLCSRGRVFADNLCRRRVNYTEFLGEDCA